MIKQFLFPKKTLENRTSLAIVILRVVFGAMLMTHGWGKLVSFSDYAPHFVGGSVGLALSVFAEFFCAFAIVVGFLHQLAIIPLIINMSVAFFLAHKAKIIGEGNGEVVLLYLTVYISLFISGPGKYAVDRFIATKFTNE